MSEGKFIIGLAGTWIILTLLADLRPTAEIASSLAIAIAVTATFVFGQDAAANVFNTGKV